MTAEGEKHVAKSEIFFQRITGTSQVETDEFCNTVTLQELI